MLNEIPGITKIKSMLFQPTGYTLRKSEKNTNYAVLSGITLNESSLIAEGWFDMRKVSSGILPEHYFKH